MHKVYLMAALVLAGCAPIDHHSHYTTQPSGSFAYFPNPPTNIAVPAPPVVSAPPTPAPESELVRRSDEIVKSRCSGRVWSIVAVTLDFENDPNLVMGKCFFVSQPIELVDHLSKNSGMPLGDNLAFYTKSPVETKAAPAGVYLGIYPFSFTTVIGNQRTIPTFVFLGPHVK